MLGSNKYAHILRAGCRQSLIALGAWLLLSGVAAAQNQPLTPANPDLSLPTATGMPLRVAFPPVPGLKANDAAPSTSSPSRQAYKGGPSSTAKTGDAQTGVRRITLEEAQQGASGANNPLVRLGELSVQVAKEHRLAWIIHDFAGGKRKGALKD